MRAEALSDELVSSRLSHYTSGAIINAEAFFNGQAHIQLEKLEETDQYLKQSCIDDYVAHMLSYVELNNFTPLKVVVNAGNGAAGPAIDAIEHEMQRQNVPIEFVKVHHNADGTFPNGIPNPLLPGIIS